MKRIHHVAVLSSILLTSLFCSLTFGQVSKYVMEVKVPPASEQTPLSISVEIAQNIQVQRVLLEYRQFGETEYKELEMLLSGRTAVATIPGKTVTPPYVEYFIKFQLAGNEETTFPLENPEVNPIKIAVKGVDPKDAEISFLSPEPGETLSAEDLAVAVSLMFASDAVDKQRTRIYLDGSDVTKEALLSDDVVLYSPKNFNKPLSLGEHSIKIELVDTKGRIYHTKQMAFNLSTAAAIEEEKSSLQYMGNAQVELRNEKVDVTNTAYQRADVRFNGTYKFLAFGYDMHLTNENTPERQPQNRFLATVQAEDYAKVQIGDAYPSFPSLFISGKRVRGVTGALTLGFFNVDVSYGQTERFIEGVTKGLTAYKDSSAAAQDDRDKKYVRTDTSVWYMPYDRGTYSRKFLAVRPSFGSGENFQWGFSYIRATDDTNSIQYGNYPADNFVAGTDLLIALDNQRFKWITQVAFSLENTNILGGNYSDQDFKDYKLANAKTAADSAQGLQDAQDLIDLAKLGRNFLVVNPNMSPLNPTEGFPSLAFESELTLNYFNNYVRAVVFRRGKNYKSYGNEFVQTDIAGVNLSDRIRLFNNKVMTSLSYESKWNNLAHDNSKPITTFNTFNGSVTAYPGVSLPTITVGYGFNTRKNPIDLSMYYSGNKPVIIDVDTIGLSSIINKYSVVPSSDGTNTADEVTNRVFVATNYDFIFGARHSVSATLSLANKKDNTFYKRDQDNLNVSTALTTTYRIPLQTTLSFIVSHNATYAALQDSVRGYLPTTQKGTFDYQTISFNARYRFLNDRLSVLATLAPSFGDFKRFMIQTGFDFQVMENHYLVGELDVIQNPGKENDVIASMMYRLNF
ncbi:MAG: hypothetical protein EHM64_12535 [Ignavibacteriae bacterium]|nr:MAG: hypothetical protein EHM64_12535 [Ignavibacteriota bacterium]